MTFYYLTNKNNNLHIYQLYYVKQLILHVRYQEFFVELYFLRQEN